MHCIKNTRDLRRAIRRGHTEYHLCLNGGLYSWKSITEGKRGRFHIINHIDETEQTLSGAELYRRNLSNIGESMKMGGFIVAPPNS